jgi:ornithine cyclodeaminase/alanine dehydrogenase-like protein (mu-crystallin family)
MVSEIENLTLLYKPAASVKEKMVGIKILSQVEQNRNFKIPVIQGLVFLINLTDGRFISLMDGTHLTALRTGAASGLATRLLAREDAKVAAIFGAGAQGRTQLLAIDAVRNLERVYVYDINEAAIRLFADDMGSKVKADILTGRMADIKEADVICTATGSTKPLFSLNDLKKGVHINAIGSYKPNMQEIDPLIVASSRLYLDHIDSVVKESGDIIRPLESGIISKEHILGEIGDVFVNRVKGRLSDNDITLFKSVGLAVQDLAMANAVYQYAEEKEIGQIIYL